MIRFFLALALVVGCAGGKSQGGVSIQDEQHAGDLAIWERYKSIVDSLVRTDHSFDAYQRSAWILFNEGDYLPALHYTDLALAVVTDSVRLMSINNVRYLRSVCFDRMGQTGESIEEMKAIISLNDPEDPEGMREAKENLAFDYYKLKRYDEALAALPDSLFPGGEQLRKDILAAIAGQSEEQ